MGAVEDKKSTKQVVVCFWLNSRTLLLWFLLPWPWGASLESGPRPRERWPIQVWQSGETQEAAQEDTRYNRSVTEKGCPPVQTGSLKTTGSQPAVGEQERGPGHYPLSFPPGIVMGGCKATSTSSLGSQRITVSYLNGSRIVSPSVGWVT
jgi:hypothetical protein